MNIVYENAIQICCLFVRYYSQIFIKMKTMIGINFILYEEFLYTQSHGLYQKPFLLQDIEGMIYYMELLWGYNYPLSRSNISQENLHWLSTVTTHFQHSPHLPMVLTLASRLANLAQALNQQIAPTCSTGSAVSNSLLLELSKF